VRIEKKLKKKKRGEKKKYKRMGKEGLMSHQKHSKANRS
jgi:hypothetical protein